MKNYHTQILIDASIEKVWEVLTDFSAYPTWNPLIKKLTGELRGGGQIELYILPLEDNFKAQLIDYKKEEEMSWKGYQYAPFLLTGNHYYKLIKKNTQQTVLEHGESFTGLLSFFLPAKLLAKMKQTFVAHNEALKWKVEHEG